MAAAIPLQVASGSLVTGHWSLVTGHVLPLVELEFTDSGVSVTPSSPFHEPADRTRTAVLCQRPEGGHGPPASRRQSASQRLG